MSERTTAPDKADQAESRPSLTERMQSTLSSASQEHRDNARPEAANKAKAADKAKAAGKAHPATPRRARLRLSRVDPWSVMKTSFLLSVAFGIVTFIAVFMVWTVLGAAGVWDSINTAVASIVDSESSEGGFDVTDYVGMGRVLGFTLVVAVLDVILLTAIATLTAFLYNLAAALLGGVEVTLSEDQG
ncbi:MAG: DUF3566 domain-containing protein [Nocardioides sp.]|nr:DUF3566 domain-containing protein [Nocardioides sp.]